MKRIAALLPVLILLVGCSTARVPTSIVQTPVGPFSLPKDMDIEIQDLKFFRDTNGVTHITAKRIHTRSRNNPAVIGASAFQDETNWKGLKEFAEGVVETGIKAGKASQGVPP
jgi:hypothetical protein